MQANTAMALLLSFAAGLSTVAGGLCVLFARAKSQRLIAGALAFAGGVMVSLSLTDLFLEAKETFCAQMGHAPGVLMTVSLMAAGMLLAKLMDTFVPQNLDANLTDQGSKRLLRTGMVSMLGLAIHNLPEGIATFTAAYANAQMGFSTAFAVAMHNIPEGISIALPIYYATKNRRRAIGMALLSGLAEPLGAVLTMLFLRPFMTTQMLAVIFSLVIGIMLYIAFAELIPSAYRYQYPAMLLVWLLTGICLMPLTNML